MPVYSCVSEHTRSGTDISVSSFVIELMCSFVLGTEVLIKAGQG